MNPRDFGYQVRPAAQLVGAYQLDAHTLEGGSHAREAIARLLEELGYNADDPVLTDLLLAATHISSSLLDATVAAESQAEAAASAGVGAGAEVTSFDDATPEPGVETGAGAGAGADAPSDAASFAGAAHGEKFTARTNKEILRDIISTFNEATPEPQQPGDPLLIVAEYTPSRHGWRVDVSTINKGNTIVRASECSGPPQAYRKAQVLIEQIRAQLPGEQVQVRHQVEGQEAGFRRWAAAYGW